MTDESHRTEEEEHSLRLHGTVNHRLKCHGLQEQSREHTEHHQPGGRVDGDLVDVQPNDRAVTCQEYEVVEAHKEVQREKLLVDVQNSHGKHANPHCRTTVDEYTAPRHALNDEWRDDRSYEGAQPHAIPCLDRSEWELALLIQFCDHCKSVSK